MNKTVLIAVGLIAALPVAAMAQTCSSPLPLGSSQTYTADTTASSDQMSTIAGVSSPGNEIVYFFTAGDVATSESISITDTDYDWAIYLTTSCQANIPGGDLANAQAGASGSTGTMPLNSGGSALTPGTQYFVIVSGEPGGTTTSGVMSFSTPTPLPVTLQNFSVK